MSQPNQTNEVKPLWADLRVARTKLTPWCQVASISQVAMLHLGKVNRTIVLTFPSGSLTARKSAGGFIACNGRGQDADGIWWNVPTAMPLNPGNGKSCPVDGTDINDFLGNLAG